MVEGGQLGIAWLRRIFFTGDLQVKTSNMNKTEKSSKRGQVSQAEESPLVLFLLICVLGLLHGALMYEYILL